MRSCKVLAVLLFLATFAFTQAPRESAPPPAATKAHSFDLDAIDKAADPCVDFYQYACGNWMKLHPIPPEYPSWGNFSVLHDRNQEILRQILEEAAKPDPKRSAVSQKIGDYYSSCMDERSADAAGARPIEAELKRIAAMKDKKDIATELVHLHLIDNNALFGFGSTIDYKDARQQIAAVDQAGLSLPDRDYYLKEDPKSKDIRDKYVAHVQKMLEMVGDKPDAAAAGAKSVLALETALAKASLDRTARRDPNNRWHPMSREQMTALAPGFDWQTYLTGLDAPRFERMNVGNPDFLKAVGGLLQSEAMESWRTYLRWKLVNQMAKYLSTPFVDEDFDFNGKTLRGTEKILPRWKRCVDYTDRDLGEALGQPYVDRTFGAEGKARTLKMVEAIERVMSKDLEGLDWMTEATKKRAFEKLHDITNKIGYPDQWRDYSKYDVKRGDFVGNIERGRIFESRRDLNKIGQPVDKKEWGMSPPTVNAYYSSQHNDINFPAGILQPPFYDNNIDDAVNMGAMGLVVGHELTHGFDDQGRKFDGNGNLNDWWTPEDAKAFEQRASCIVDEYGSFSPIEGEHLNGKLTLGENTADNGGALLAYMALMDLLGVKEPPKIDGYTAPQRFFIGYGQVWCQNVRPEYARMLVKVDPHSPGRFRVNGVVQNMPQFQKAFGCKAGQPMVRQNACRVW
ncbi:MAG TPA: M13 family metallopeptidase [Terriglobales bacterium]|nr:M13 family metallopeptidase [Terriglobales bacterium]